MELRLYGIRHHGPGSAKAVLSALSDFRPDVLVIEAPADTEDSWNYLNIKGFCPPVALLVYNTDNLQQASYYPFAHFSPEWNAVHYALEQQIPIVNMDLPMAMRWGYENKETSAETLFTASPKTAENPDAEGISLQQAIAQDPLGYLARLAGYTDIERWWEATLEHHDHQATIFETILQLMTELRKAALPPAGLEAMREAYMRKTLREVQKKGYQRVAVVCGAWHTPVLAEWKSYKATNDNALLKGSGKVKTQYTWIPWTYQRLANQSGYGAGIQSPAWYAFIFDSKEDALVKWMSRVAILLRERDLEASSASVIEAVRLAETLATLRLLPLPGIEELWESAVAVFGQGDPTKLQLVQQQWMVGDAIGDVPAKVPNVPLHADIEAQAKTLRIPKPADKTWIKATAQKRMGGLDLRKEHDLLQSQFLHRLTVLGVPWGEEGKASGREQGTMNEYWQLQWKPELILRIIEVGMWGNTLEEAAANYMVQTAQSATRLAELALLFRRGLKAQLPAALDRLAQTLQQKAAVTTDVEDLIASLDEIVPIYRYGDVRQTDKKLLQHLIHEGMPRAAIGLPQACLGLDEEQSRLWNKRIEVFRRCIALVQEPHYTALWFKALRQLVAQESAHALLRGNAARLLFDAQQCTTQETAQLLYQALSASQELAHSAAWIEGFLSGSGLLLLHHPVLWHLIDEWVSSLSADTFQSILPILRRTFSRFAPPERQKMMQLVKQGADERGDADLLVVESELVEAWLPTMRGVLGG